MHDYLTSTKRKTSCWLSAVTALTGGTAVRTGQSIEPLLGRAQCFLLRLLATQFVPLFAACLLCLPSHTLQANSTPSFDLIENRYVRVDEFIHFNVRPVDPENIVPGLYAQNLPEGSEFFDNRDGSRTFRWTPRNYQIGEHRILFVTVDALDRSLRYSQEVFLTVLGSDSANSQVESDNSTQAAAPVDSVEESDSSANDVLRVDGNYYPELDVPVAVTVTAGEPMTLSIAASDRDGGVPGLVAHALPAGAALVDNGNGGRNLVWTPNPWQTGNFDVVVVAIDNERNDHRSQQTLRISVVEPDSTAVAADVPNQSPAAVPVVQISPNPTDSSNNDSGNQAPFFRDLTHQTISIGDTLRFIVAPVDPDGDVPGLFADRLPFNSSLRDNFDGTKTMVWAPYPADEGDFWITFTAVDARDNNLKTNQSVRITVENNGGFNFRPVINGINNPVVRAGDTLRQLVQPVDPDGEVSKLSVLNPPEGADFVDNGDGTRTLVWPTNSNHITERDGNDEPHIVDFLAVDPRDESLRDDHQLRISVVEPQSRQRDGERLRVLAEQRGILVGFAAMLNSSKLADTDMYLDIAAEEFNIVTPENSHKWGWIQPRRGDFRFTDADELDQYAIENGMELHGHPLVWHSQLPGWVQNMELAEAEQIMYEHIDVLVSRYRGQVGLWDVVNEAMEEDGTYRQSIWYEAMAETYISKAFRRARERDPEAILVYNDYDVAWPGPKADGMYNMVRSELAQGTPIDAVGFQMHFWTDFDDYEGVRQNLQRFADLGLDIYVTEFDVAMNQRGEEQLQATVYQRIAEICLQQPRCKALQAWGYTDRYSWRYNNRPLMLTERYLAKPAYYAWQRALSQ